MHSGAVITENGLGHEGNGLVVAGCDVHGDVLVDLQLISLLGEGVEAGRNLVLAAGSNLMVMSLDYEAEVLEGLAHLGADVHVGVYRRYREVAALDERTVAEVAFLVLLAAVPRSLIGINLVEAAVHVVAEGDVVEQEELRLRSEDDGVGDAG